MQLLVETVIAKLGHGVLPKLTKLSLPLPLQSHEDKWIWDFSSFENVVDITFYEHGDDQGRYLIAYLAKELEAVRNLGRPPPVDLGKLVEFRKLMFVIFVIDL
jgi:hypothetical protein